MLKINDIKHFNEVMAFAAQRGLAHELVDKLQYLSTYCLHRAGEGETSVCHLYKDFAAYSWTFQINIENDNQVIQPVMGGGLIYQGPGLPADGSFPQLTVSLSNEEGWRVHT